MYCFELGTQCAHFHWYMKACRQMTNYMTDVSHPLKVHASTATTTCDLFNGCAAVSASLEKAVDIRNRSNLQTITTFCWCLPGIFPVINQITSHSNNIACHQCRPTNKSDILDSVEFLLQALLDIND